jgi:DNA modification methylase
MPDAFPSTLQPDSRPELELDRLYTGDCLKLFPQVASDSIDLIFADPPFNIGYDYDIYDDRREAQSYLDWTKAWGREVVRTLKPSGTFWLAIGDEYAAEMKVLFHRELGLSLRNWVIWYYTFGVHCTKKFTRSHAHLFYFVKDPKRFTLNSTRKMSQGLATPMTPTASRPPALPVG